MTRLCEEKMATSKKNTTIKKEALPKTFEDRPFYGLELDPEQLVLANTLLNPDIDIVFVNAKAGTGKTTIATGVANMLVQHGAFSKIIYIMSPYGEQRQGWLPGTLTEKSSVYFEAFYQALATCNINPQVAVSNDSMVNIKTGDAYITCITDSFLRGSNFDDAVIILDEAQNCTTRQLKTILTRVGKSVKVIVIGHEFQCDLKDVRTSGFIKYLEHFRDEPHAAVCQLLTNHRSWISQHADELQE